MLTIAANDKQGRERETDRDSNTCAKHIVATLNSLLITKNCVLSFILKCDQLGYLNAVEFRRHQTRAFCRILDAIRESYYFLISCHAHKFLGHRKLILGWIGSFKKSWGKVCGFFACLPICLSACLLALNYSLWIFIAQVAKSWIFVRKIWTKHMFVHMQILPSSSSSLCVLLWTIQKQPSDRLQGEAIEIAGKKRR